MILYISNILPTGYGFEWAKWWPDKRNHSYWRTIPCTQNITKKDKITPSRKKSHTLSRTFLWCSHTLNYTRRTKSLPVGKIIPKSQKSFKWANSNLDKVIFSVKKATQLAKSIQIDKTIPNCKNHSRSRNFIQWAKPCIKSGKKKLK